jgi:tRNA (cmo5U34)-methyltransferase
MTTTTTPSSLGHMPRERWTFDESVTAVFDDMLARSIPHLDQMREVVLQTGSGFVGPSTDIVDLGCARGEAMAPLVEKFGQDRNNKFVGVEVSEPMLTACRERFQSHIESGMVEIRNDDLRTSYPPVHASLTLCVLTLQFIPIEHRLRVLANAFKHTASGGAFLLVEKVLGVHARTDDMLVECYYTYKRKMGYTQEEIDRKRLSLEGILVPITAHWNEELLRGAGFRHIECIWRYLNFCAWIAVRE